MAQMVESETNWIATASYVEKDLRKKKIEEKERTTVRTITPPPPWDHERRMLRFGELLP